ncbi:hypothetical protein BDZ89DRAFT_1141758 [Hymenopellis radicata]|nr:hypothetical protein BDZ89DRAFT_1141758 [Hymenopellis radicata]
MFSPQLESPITLIHDIFELTPSSDADLVIRTSDNVSLYVTKSFLCHSKFFADDGFLDEIKERLPEFRVEEDCRDMRAILHLCYPTNVAATPYILEAAFWGSLVSALQKRTMERAMASLRDMVAASEWPRTQPLMTFVMARRCDWEDIGRIAAWESLRSPLRAQVSFSELDSISGLDYHCFIEYFWRCTDAARDFLKGSGASFEMPGRAGSDSIRECQVLALKVNCRFPESLLNDRSFPKPEVATGRKFHKPQRVECEGCSGLGSDALLVTRTDLPRVMHPWLRPLIQRALSEVERCPRISLSHESILQDTVVTAWTACPSQTPEMIQTIVKLLDDELESVLRSVKLEVEGW